MKKLTLILVLAVCMLFSISSVCAADVNESDIQMPDRDQPIEYDNPVSQIDENVITKSDGGTFTALQSKIDNAGENSTVTLENDYEYDDRFDTYGINIDKVLTIDGKGHKIDAKQKSRIFHVIADNVVLKNITFANSNYDGSGGAIICNGNNVMINGCVFVNNTAKMGGAISWNTDNSRISGCIFVNNSATDDLGGAIIWAGNNNIISDCTFINNHAKGRGGAIFCFNDYDIISNCLFMNNTGDGGAIYSLGQCIADSCIFKTPSDTYVKVTVLQPTLTVFNSTYAYNSGDKLKFRLTSNGGMPITNRNINVAVYKKDSSPVGSYNCSSGDGWVVNLPAGSYVAVCRATDYDIDCVNATITVINAATEINAPEVKTVYNKNKYLVITLKDGKGKGVAKVKLTVIIKASKTYTTDKNGRVKVPLKNLAPKKYTAKITFKGNENYLKSSATAKVTVKKATPKIKAKKKSKAKKYVVTLKGNNKPIKNAKVTLKIKGKTYKATTNKKGKATFKITKKGKFKATIKYKGNKFYNKVTKKIKITLK